MGCELVDWFWYNLCRFFVKLITPEASRQTPIGSKQGKKLEGRSRINELADELWNIVKSWDKIDSSSSKVPIEMCIVY